MARNSGNGNSGCFVVILFLLFFAGNACLFSGALENDLAGNPFAIIMVLAAVIADIAIRYWTIKSIAKSIGQARQQKLHAKADAIKAEIHRIISLYRFPNIVSMGSPFQKDELRVKQYNKAIIQRWCFPGWAVCLDACLCAVEAH